MRNSVGIISSFVPIFRVKGFTRFYAVFINERLTVERETSEHA